MKHPELSNHRIALIPEMPPKPVLQRLGRHVHFDERSKNYRVTVRKNAKPVSKTWERRVPVWNQGDLGSCVGNGSVGLLATDPFFKPRTRITEALAVKTYSIASGLDDINGQYKPTDTGTTVLAGMKALVQQKKAKSYHWCLGLNDVQMTLGEKPVALGINWYESFDRPNSRGLIHIAGSVRGGHCVYLFAIDVSAKEVMFCNSWGPDWGRSGCAVMSFADLDRLLHENGEAATIIV